MATQNMTLIAPVCSCCEQPATLIPRDDLARALAACPNSGQLYRAEGGRYAQTTMPPLVAERGAAASVRIDLSRTGYA
ncbi:MAG: hypothetical protein SH847_07465 [Roseiflexaceae bacterium]|nr:hypothetical protein [Roseiflexaceae bacterium]